MVFLEINRRRAMGTKKKLTLQGYPSCDTRSLPATYLPLKRQIQLQSMNSTITDAVKKKRPNIFVVTSCFAAASVALVRNSSASEIDLDIQLVLTSKKSYRKCGSTYHSARPQRFLRPWEEPKMRGHLVNTCVCIAPVFSAFPYMRTSTYMCVSVV